MDQNKDGGPAFPCEVRHTENRDGRWIDRWIPEGGMSLRDYFAGQALAGLCAAVSDYSGSRLINEDAFVADAYALADAMLKARGQGAA